MDEELAIIEEELVYGALRRERLWQRLGLMGLIFGTLGCLSAAAVAIMVEISFFGLRSERVRMVFTYACHASTDQCYRFARHIRAPYAEPSSVLHRPGNALP